MKGLRIVILTLVGLLFFAPMKAEGQTGAVAATEAQLQDDYIAASLLVISPDRQIYSVFGHCALRLSCPSQGMDYCFTFETASDTKGMLTFLRGAARGGFLASRTDNYLETYRAAGRGVEQYALNLTPEEKLRLWMTVDEEITRGYSRHYDYLHTHCTSEIVELVKRAILPATISYGELPAPLQGSFRDVLQYSSLHPWNTFLWQTIMGPAGDETEPLEDKLAPKLLPIAWQGATVDGNASRPLISAAPTALVAATVEQKASCISPTLLFGLFLLVSIVATLGQKFCGWQRLPRSIDVLLIALHSIVAIFLLWLVVCSRLEGTAWNWYLLAFNPLPQLVGIFTHQWLLVGRCLLGVILAMLLLTPFIPQLDLPHGLLLATLATRLVAAERPIKR